MFLATNGQRLGATWLTGQVHHYIEAVGHRQDGELSPLSPYRAPRSWSKAGADIRYVQELLGHRDLASTQIYTRVAPERLAAIHAATHPGSPTAAAAPMEETTAPAIPATSRGVRHRRGALKGPALTLRITRDGWRRP